MKGPDALPYCTTHVAPQSGHRCACWMLAPAPCRKVASTLMGMGMGGLCNAEASGPLSCREGSQYSEEQGLQDDLGHDGEPHRSGSWHRRL